MDETMKKCDVAKKYNFTSSTLLMLLSI